MSLLQAKPRHVLDKILSGQNSYFPDYSISSILFCDYNIIQYYIVLVDLLSILFQYLDTHETHIPCDFDMI